MSLLLVLAGPAAPPAIIGARFALAAVPRRDTPEEEDAVRTDHALRLLFGRTPAAAATAGAPWYLWRAPTQRAEPEEDARRADHSLLHRYRVGYQTVGQPAAMWPRPQARLDDLEFEPPRQIGLEAFRKTALVATAGQPWWMWPRAVADQWVEPNPIVIDHAAALYPFRPHDAVTPTVPPTADVQVPAGRKRHKRYIAVFKEQEYEFPTLEQLEEFVEQVRASQTPKPKRIREPIRIKLAKEFAEEVAEVIEPPQRLSAMPISAALAQVRRIEQAMLKQREEDDENEVLLWLM
jgi:hypothetical protein